MNKKIIACLIGVFVVIVGSLIIMSLRKDDSLSDTKKISARVLKVEDSTLTIQDSDNIIYTFNVDDIDTDVGENIVLKYTGILDKNTQMQDVIVVDYTTSLVVDDNSDIPSDWQDNGIFSNYYTLAYNKLKTLSLDEKIGQIFLVRYPDTNAKELLKKYNFAGYVFFEKDFRNKSEVEVQTMMKELQSIATIPILTATDEEGGSVVRVSSNPNLVSSKFKSSQELYASGGFDLIKEDTITKSKILNNLGINLNLAPVVDVSTNPSDYMYQRSLGQGTELTSTYAKTVISASKNTGVSYTLKHFPGYGNNADTHTGSSTDSRSYDDILNNDIPPFEAGINEGAEAVLVSHNIVTSIDSSNPASLSPSVHNLLRNNLGFTGIIITDDLDMAAVSNIDDVTLKAVLAGNDLIITTDYEESINSVKRALANGTISESYIDKLAFRVIAWKYYKGLMFENQK